MTSLRNFFSLTLFAYIFFSCSENEVVTIDNKYANNLYGEVETLNKSLQLNIDNTYLQFDIALVNQVLFNAVPNLDSIRDVVFELKHSTYKIKSRVKNELSFESYKFNSATFIADFEEYTIGLYALIEPDNVDLINQIGENLGDNQLKRLTIANRDQFKLEKELIYSKILATELIIATHLLSEIDYELVNNK